jgi:hypothetical protein
MAKQHPNGSRSPHPIASAADGGKYIWIIHVHLYVYVSIPIGAGLIVHSANILDACCWGKPIWAADGQK